MCVCVCVLEASLFPASVCIGSLHSVRKSWEEGAREREGGEEERALSFLLRSEKPIDNSGITTIVIQHVLLYSRYTWETDDIVVLN